MSVILYSVPEIQEKIAKNAKSRRLDLNLSQQSLSSRSGVSYGVIKKFEQTGKISLESLLKIAVILDVTDEFLNLFADRNIEKALTLDALINYKERKRGRK